MRRSLPLVILSCLFFPVAGHAQAVVGVLWDGDTKQPLVEAQVVLLDENSTAVTSALTDDEGWYRLEAEVPGNYTVTTQAPGYASILTEPFMLAVDETVRRDLIVPITGSVASDAVAQGTKNAVERSVAVTCGDRYDPASNGILLGLVTDETTGVGLPGLPVTIEWRGAVGASFRRRVLTVDTDQRGIYLFCDAPGGEAVLMNVEALDREVPGVTVGIESGTLQRQDLVVNLSDPTRPGSVLGRVTDHGTGVALSGAEIRIRDTAVQVLTDDNGFFKIPEIPWGVYVLEVDYIGYAHQEAAFRVMGARAHQVDVSMPKDAIELDPITVTVRSRRWYADMEGLQHRMASGFGHFITSDVIEQRGITRLSDALRDTPGVRIRPSGLRGAVVFVRGKVCVPQVFVDGRLYRLDPDLLFNEGFGSDLETIEVYTGVAGLPPEFNYGSNPCGAVVVWTKRGR